MLGLWGKGGFKKYWKDTIMLYDDMNFSRMVKNESSLGRRVGEGEQKVGIDFVGAYTEDTVMYFYLLHSMPRKLLIKYKSRIRLECRDGVRVSFFNYLRGHKINWQSPQLRNRLYVLKQVGEDKNSTEVDSYNLHSHLVGMTNQRWIEDSLQYLSVADIERGRALVKSSILMVVSGKRGQGFDDSLRSIENTIKGLNVGITRVLYEIPELFRYFSPFSMQSSKALSNLVPVQVLTDEIVARYNMYTQGTLGVGGTYCGTDVESQYPVLKKVKSRDDVAENWIITAETGGGKSHAVKDLILQLLAQNYNGTIMDIEGFEYLPIARFMSHKTKVVVLNMAEGSGNYFDPVEIPDPTGIEEIDEKAKDFSVNFTLSTFKTLLGKAYYEDTWLDTVINDAVSETYRKRDVTNDDSTWFKSKGLTLFSVYDMIKLLKKENFRTDEKYISALEKAIATLDKYFEPHGTRAHVFSQRVNISDIIDAGLVVCSFGMAGKAPQAVDEVQLALMQLGAAQLSHQRSVYSKSQGKFNFKIWEEFQRWGNFPDSEKTIGVAVTGGRKLGDVNIIITNDIAQILKNDRFGVLGNHTSFFIGAIADSQTRADLLTRLSVPHMIPELEMISKAKKAIDEEEETGRAKEDRVDDPLAFAFLVGLDRRHYGIVKFQNPAAITQSTLFKTGVDVSRANKGKEELIHV